MGLLHELAVESFGIGGRQMLKRFVGLNPRPKEYKEYKKIIQDFKKNINTTSCTKIDIIKTYEEVAAAHGFKRETLETLQTVEFMNQFYRMLISKGYTKPKALVFFEYRIPSGSGLAGENFNGSIIFNPRCIKNIDFRVPIHEQGHLMHKKLGFLAFNYDYYKQQIGKLFHKLGLFKNRTFNHLNKKEQEILAKDLQRAWNEGYFTHNPVKGSIEEALSLCKTDSEKVKLKSQLNRLYREFRKNPVKFYMPNMLFNRMEFVADYFHLAARGFKFSPEIKAKYIEFGGPEIKGVITKDDLNKIEELRKLISKKTLADYGYTMEV
ncbi:MAG: hypothetical protein VZR09_03565 [Candidatus Gastranaerophilaceae bacterium]|nr:hypothetical protein [Candidatus Gastranaerophilaceae bacterium]